MNQNIIYTQNHLKNKLQRIFHYGDRPWFVLLTIMALITLALILAIGWMLWNNSNLARQIGPTFFLPTFDASWNPALDKYQAWPFIYGTIITSIMAMFIAVPFSLGIAIFLAELSPDWLQQPLSWMIELLAAIPSVVYGLWGIFTFLPVFIVPLGNLIASTLGQVPGLDIFFKGPIPASGSSRFAAGLILAIMIIPTITAVTRDVFKAIPSSQREASFALGATRWETIWKVLIPYGLSGILGATILGLGRALGETMAVTMVIGNSIEGSLSLLRPGYTMSSVIANQFAEAVGPLHTSSLVYIGLILFFMTLFINSIARFLVWRVSSRLPQEARQ
jgi:phosphate transport system permease protein